MMRVAKAALGPTITRRNGDAGDNAERYDARAEIAGWDKRNFADDSW